MSHNEQVFKEGDLYKRIQIGEHVFELRYGYDTESDRALGEPYVLFPKLCETPMYHPNGFRIVSAIQNPCEFYEVTAHKMRDECCVDCIHYMPPGDDIGICTHPCNAKKPQKKKTSS